MPEEIIREIEPELPPTPLITLVRDVPVDAAVVPHATITLMKTRIAAIQLVEQRLAEARRDLTLALQAAEAAGSDVPASLIDRIEALLEMIPKEVA